MGVEIGFLSDADRGRCDHPRSRHRGQGRTGEKGGRKGRGRMGYSRAI